MNWTPDERAALFAVMDDGPIAIATRAVEIVAARRGPFDDGLLRSDEFAWCIAACDVPEEHRKSIKGHVRTLTAMVATLQAGIADLEGRFATEEAERVRCRDGWAAASAKADRLSPLESEVERLRVEAADSEASAARHIQEAASLRVKVAGLEEALVKEKASHELEKRAHEDTFVQKVLRIEERDALRTKVVELEGRAWVQCTTVSNECLGGCRSMKEHDRQRHQQLVSEVERLKAEISEAQTSRWDIGERLKDVDRERSATESRLAAIREIILKMRKAPRGEAVDSDTYDRGFGDGWVARGAKMRAELDALDADTPNHPASLERWPGNSPKISDGSPVVEKDDQKASISLPVTPDLLASVDRAALGLLHPCSATCTHEDAAKPGHPERIAALSKRLATIDVLHPNGRCTCGGEGLCQWCTETAGREETDAAIESGAESLRAAVEKWARECFGHVPPTLKAVLDGAT
jgi:hypothetical protein